MPRCLSALAFAVGALSLLATPAVADTPAEAQERLGKMLEGRVAGEPQSCIRTFNSEPLTVLEGTAIVYRRGDTVWVNLTQDPRSLDDDDIMVIRKFGSGTQLCRSDTITLRDRNGGFYTGNVFLTEFVPYRTPGES